MGVRIRLDVGGRRGGGSQHCALGRFLGNRKYTNFCSRPKFESSWVRLPEGFWVCKEGDKGRLAPRSPRVYWLLFVVPDWRS